MTNLIIGAGHQGTRYQTLLSQNINVWCDICDTDYREFLLKHDPFHNIIICTPPETHKEIFEHIFFDEYAWNTILIEKPFLTKKYESTPPNWKDVYVVTNMRYHPAIQALKQNLHLIGGTMHIDAGYQYAAQGNHLNAKWDSTHELDYISWLLDTTYVQIIPHTYFSGFKDWAEYSGLLKTGTSINIYFRYFGAAKHRWCKLTGVLGTLEWNSYGKTPEVATVTFTDLAGQAKTVYHSSNINPDQMYLDMLKDFLLSPTKLQSAQDAYNILQQVLPN